MKKTSLLLALLFSLFLFSCDDTTGDDSQAPAPSADQEAAYAVSVLNDGLQNIDLEELFTSALENSGNDSVEQTVNWNTIFSSAGLNSAIPLGTIYDENGMTIDANLIIGLTDGIGLGLIFTMDDYQLQTGEEPLPTVSGQLTVGITCQFDLESLLSQTPSAIQVTANTPADNQLSFTGGTLDGQTIGLSDVKLTYSMSSFNLGSPLSATGIMVMNGVSIPFDSKILELLTSFM